MLAVKSNLDKNVTCRNQNKVNIPRKYSKYAHPKDAYVQDVSIELISKYLRVFEDN